MPAQTTIQVRRGTAASWTSTNPTLAAGEVGFETDTGKFKIGTGSTVWTGLGYATVLPSNFAAKGDLLVATGAGTFTAQAVGSNNQVLMADSTQADGVKYANEATATLTAKGDILTATAANTIARQAVGSNGYTLVADSSTSTGLAYSPTFFAGKNKIINGDFGIWQRGTSFSNPASGAFTADRWSVVWDGSGATRTISQQTFTAGNAITGYEPGNFFRFNQSVAGTSGTYNLFQNRMEDVRTFAGQTVTVSFWAKAASNITLPALNWEQSFGTGGSPSATTSGDFATNIAITTSWTRYTYTVTVPSISGKTVGTTTPGYLGLRIWLPVNSTFTFDIWGVQVEAGSTATQFQTATGTIQGELAAAQRYYYRVSMPTTYTLIGFGFAGSTTTCYLWLGTPVEMRVYPTAIDYSGLNCHQISNDAYYSSGTWTLRDASKSQLSLVYTHGSAVFTTGNSQNISNSGTANAYVGFSAEL